MLQDARGRDERRERERVGAEGVKGVPSAVCRVPSAD